MKKLTGFYLILALVLLIPIQSFALTKLAQTGLKFLDVCVGARPAAMGEAYTMVGNDVNAIFHNPAGIAQMKAEKIDLSFCKINWIANTSIDAFGMLASFGSWGNFGFSLITPDYGDIIGTRVSGTELGYKETGLLDVGGFSAGLAYGRRLTDKFMIGAVVKYCSENLGENLFALTSARDSTWIEKNKVSTVAYDLGTIFYPGFKSFRLGMYIRNFSGAVKYEESDFQLPLVFKMGVAMDILDFFGEHPDNSFVVDIDAVHPRDYTERLQVGGEFWYKNMLALRGGYKFNYDEEGVTFGVGLNAGGIKLDYAYSEFGVFDNVNRISLGISF